MSDSSFKCFTKVTPKSCFLEILSETVSFERLVKILTTIFFLSSDSNKFDFLLEDCRMFSKDFVMISAFLFVKGTDQPILLELSIFVGIYL